jgi:uncharacterized protein
VNPQKKEEMMNRIISLALLVLLLTAALTVPGAAEEIPEQRGYVSDYAEIIDAKTEIALSLLLGTMEEKYGNRVVILTVKSTAPLGIDDYGAEVFRQWDLGEDDLLFLVALRDGKVRLDAGRRLNRSLTDERLKEIMDREIMPSFEQGNFSQGILRGTVALTSAIKEIRNREAKEQALVTWTIVGLAVLVALALFFVLRD